jgi:ankyrin repeat protein
MKNDDSQSLMVPAGSRNGVTRGDDFVTTTSDNVSVVIYPVELFKDRFWSQSLPPSIYKGIEKGASVRKADGIPAAKRAEARQAGRLLTAEVAEREAIRQFDSEWPPRSNKGSANERAKALKAAVLGAVVEKVGPDGLDRNGNPFLLVTSMGGFKTIFSGSYEGTLFLLDAGANPNLANELGRTPLHGAIQSRNDETVRLLLSHGADPNAGDREGITPLMIASKYGLAEQVELLLEKGADPDIRDGNGETALLHAMANDGNSRKGVVAALLARGADINIGNRDGVTPLLRAKRAEAILDLVEAGADVKLGDRAGRNVLVTWHWQAADESAVRALLEAGADPDAREEPEGKTPLMKAVQRNAPGIVRLLVEHGADALARDRAEGRSALSFAAGMHDAESTAILVRAKSDPNAKDAQGRPPLWHALERRHRERTGDAPAVVREILAAGGDPNAVVAERSLLMIAASRGDADIVGSLLSKGADLDAQAPDGWTAVSGAASNGGLAALDLLLARKPDLSGAAGRRALSAGLKHPEAIRRLLAAGAAVDAQDEKGTTVLGEGASAGNADVVRAILSTKPDIEARSADGRTPLFLGVMSGSAPVVKALLDAGAAPGGKDLSGQSPLMVAAVRGDAACVRLLLERKADHSERDPNGRTPLIQAAEANSPGAVAALIAAGADVNATSSSGRSALSAAVENRRDDIRKLLTDAGAR